MPRQLLQSVSVPFLGIGMMTPLLQSLGIPSPFHTLENGGKEHRCCKLWMTLKELSSKLILSRCFAILKMMISSLVGGWVLISRSSSASWAIAGSSGASLLNGFWKVLPIAPGVPSQLSVIHLVCRSKVPFLPAKLFCDPVDCTLLLTLGSCLCLCCKVLNKSPLVCLSWSLHFSIEDTVLSL